MATSKAKTTNPFAGSSDEDDEVGFLVWISRCQDPLTSRGQKTKSLSNSLPVARSLDSLDLCLSTVSRRPRSYSFLLFLLYYQVPDDASSPSSPAKQPPIGTAAGSDSATAAASSNPFDFDVDFAQVQKRRERARAAKESAKEEGA
jgi:hypothetical protein